MQIKIVFLSKFVLVTQGASKHTRIWLHLPSAVIFANIRRPNAWAATRRSITVNVLRKSAAKELKHEATTQQRKLPKFTSLRRGFVVQLLFSELNNVFIKRSVTMLKRPPCYRSLYSVLCAALVAGCQQWQGPPQIFPIGNSFVTQQPTVPQPGQMQQATIVQPPGAAVAGAAVGTECPNPVFVPVANQDLAWEQIVDVVDDYFRVERENRVQVVGNVITEGRIDTFPQVGATWLEPHRPDSVGWDNRWESTLQTIRRRAVLRVIPQQGGYLIDAVVNKELEDLPRPENSTAGAATFRNDNSLPSRSIDPVSRTRFSETWIPQGRDTWAEQALLAEIREKLTSSR